MPKPPRVPEGFTVELVAGAPLIEHPVMAGFDERGRLFLAETAGKNLERKILEKELPNFIRMIEDTDGDGKFDKSTIFADKLTFPQGVLHHDGHVYTCSSGGLWKLTDTNDDGVADQREKIVGDFGYTGNAADVHGPFLGPDGRLYWCEGRHGHHIKDKQGNTISKGKAARIFSCKTDGSDVRTFCGGGMDNPVEVVFTDEGDMIGTVNLLHHQPRGDCLVHWIYGGLYPRTDFVDQMGGEFYRTGDLLPEIHNFGHVAVSGLCRYRSGWEGPREQGQGPRADQKDGRPNREGEAPAEPSDKGNAAEKRGSAGASPSQLIHLFVTEFNTHKIKHVVLERSGSTYKASKVEDFLVSDSIDFHPTDVLEDADGSLLVIDTGGWFRIGCPVSQVEKPAIKGAIWRVRRKDAKKVEDPWGLKMDWNLNADQMVERMISDPRFAVRERAMRALERGERAKPAHVWAPERYELATKIMFEVASTGDLPSRRMFAQFVQRERDRKQISRVLSLLGLPDNDRIVEHSLIYALIVTGDEKATGEGLKSDNERVRNGAKIALEQMKRKLASADEKMPIPPPAQGTPLSKEEVAKVSAFEALLKTGSVERGRKVFEAQKSGCTLCHRIGKAGAAVSQDLSKIGAGRSERDLLESILFPSASFARGFEPYLITTPDGEQHTGLIAKETGETITLRNANNQESRIFRNAITKIEAGKVSTMPGNYADLLTKDEMADLVAYLKSLK